MKINKKNIKKGLNVLITEGPKSLVKKISTKSISNLTLTEMLWPINFKIGYIDVVVDNKINLKEIIDKIKSIKIKHNLFIFDSKLNVLDAQVLNRYTFNSVFINRAFIYLYKNKKCDFDNAINVYYKDDINLAIENYIKTIQGVKLLANYNATNNISVKTSTFLNFQGTNYYSGGAERYLLDLFEVCQKLGYNLNIYQHGEKPFFRKYNNINVIGLYVPGMKIDYSYNFIDMQTKNYIYHTYNNTVLHIYSAFQECYPNHIGPSIGISHGISWDNMMNKYSYGKDYFWENKKIYLDSAYFCNKLVSVDTNTPNWFQTIDYELGNQKFKVIPNYVDNKEFLPRDDYLKPKNKIIITYPRRLYEPRGLYIVLDIVDEILDRYKNVEFHFVGKGFDADIQNIEKKIKKYKDRIKCYSKAPEEMKEVYKYTDISLIPTLYSEGTSLSCLEALSSGNLVIATRIGGLTDLVINGYNGYLIEPSAESLKEKLIEVLNDFSKQEKIRKNGIESAKAFNKNIWKEKWEKEILSFNLKGKSQNNDLIEIYLNNVEQITESTINVIRKELEKGNLIYLRVKNVPTEDKISLNLLQVVDINEEIVTKPKKIYVVKEFDEKINRDCDIIEI